MDKILMVGEDFHLLATRAAILAKTGADVTCCNPSEFAGYLGRPGFGVVVLCHTLGADIGCGVIKETHQRWPKARVLKMVALDGKCLGECGCHVDGVTTTEPGKLLEHVAGLLGSSK